MATKNNNDLVFSLDWLSLTVWLPLDAMKEWLYFYLDLDVLEFSGHGGLGFAELYWGKHGFQVYAMPVNVKEGAETFCSLRFPGECLRAVGLDNLVSFYERLVVQGIRTNCTRFDVAFDTQGFSVADMVAARDAKLLDCRASVFREIVESQGEIRTGHTIYFGSRQSEAMLRIYYKTDGHSFGDEPFTRVELELKGERASFHFMELMASAMTDWGRVAGAWLNAFIQVGTEWWAAFVEGFKAFWLRIQRAPATLERMGTWLRRQVAPTLACYLAATTAGDVDEMWEHFRDLSREGLKRLDKLKENIARSNAADIEDVLHFFDMPTVVF